MIECFRGLQWGLNNISQRYFHHTTSRYTAFTLRKSSNIPNLRSNYWEGLANSGMLHLIPMSFSIMGMFVYLLVTLVRPGPPKDTVCKIKVASVALGAFALLFSFLSFYGHVGISQTWRASILNDFARVQHQDICDWCFRTENPFFTNVENALKALLEGGETTITKVKEDPEYVNYTEGLDIFTKHFEALKTVDLNETGVHLEVIKEYLKPICDKGISIPIGKKDLATVVSGVIHKYVLCGVLLSVWTVALSFQIMSVYCTQSNLWILIICLLSGFTSVGWWILAGLWNVPLVGLADVNLRRSDAIHSVLANLSEHITKDMIAAFLECTGNIEQDLVSDLVQVSVPVVTLYENINMAIEYGYNGFPPASKIESHLQPMKIMFNLVEKLYSPCKRINEMSKGNCSYYKNAFDQSIGLPLCTYLYWSLLVSYWTSCLLAVVLVAFTVIGFKIRSRTFEICYKLSTRTIDEPQPCLDTCPRRPIPPPDPIPKRQICPDTCLGVKPKDCEPSRYALTNKNTRKVVTCGPNTDAQVATSSANQRASRVRRKKSSPCTDECRKTG